MYNHSRILQALYRHSVETPEKVALVHSEQEVSYSELLSFSRKAASVLQNRGIKANDKIILSAKKDLNFIYLYFGAQILGIISVIVDPSSNKNRIAEIEKIIRPAYCFGYVSSQFSYCLFESLGLYKVEEYNDESPSSLSSDDVSEILFTTGTTGVPKGVCLSYANIFASADNVNGYVGNGPSDVEILGLPICHSFGLGTIRCNVILGATVVLLDNFANVRLFFKTIEQFHGTGFRIVPSVWSYICKISGKRIKEYARQIRYIEIGSAAMSLEMKRTLLDMFPSSRICMHYGLTEASRNCFLEFHDKEHLGSIGRPVNENVYVKILNSEGIEVGVNQPGEICVKGNMVLNNYLEESDTVEGFYGDFFRTGDIGYKSDDGYIYLLGREKEMINVGGKKVSPIEVEDAICSLGVGDCVCVGIPDKNGLLGEVVKAYILKGSTNLSLSEIDMSLSSLLEFYKRPVEYEWIDHIPITSSGKKQRYKLKKSIQ